MYVCVRAYTHSSIRLNTYINTYAYIHTYIHTYTYIHTHIRTYIHTYPHIHTYVRTNTHTFTLFIYLCVSVGVSQYLSYIAKQQHKPGFLHYFISNIIFIVFTQITPLLSKHLTCAFHFVTLMFLFNDALSTFYLRFYGVEHMVKNHSDSESGNPLPPHGLTD